MLCQNFSKQYFEIFFLENEIWRDMQIVSLANNFHEVWDPII